MNVNPNSALRIVRQLSDTTDTTTYYVKAVVRYSATGAVLETVNLTDEGDQRFTGMYATGSDASGNGFYIDITTTVYTDDTYTTLATNYGVEAQTYHVIQHWQHALGVGSGGGDVNYDKLRKIIKEELSMQEKLELPEQRDFTPALIEREKRLVKELELAIRSIQFPEQIQPDLEMVINSLNASIVEATDAIINAVELKPVTEPTDLSRVEQLLSTIQDIPQRLQEATQSVSSLQDYFGLKEAAEEFMGKLPKRAAESNYQTPDPRAGLAQRANKLLGL